MKFTEVLLIACSRCFNSLFQNQVPHVLLPSHCSEWLLKIVSNITLIFSLDSLGIYLCPEILLSFLSKLDIPTWLGKISKSFAFQMHYQVIKFDRRHIYSRPSQAELSPDPHYHSRRQHFLKELFPPQLKGGENFYFLPNRNREETKFGDKYESKYEYKNESRQNKIMPLNKEVPLINTDPYISAQKFQIQEHISIRTNIS